MASISGADQPVLADRLHNRGQPRFGIVSCRQTGGGSDIEFFSEVLRLCFAIDAPPRSGTMRTIVFTAMRTTATFLVALLLAIAHSIGSDQKVSVPKDAAELLE